MATKLARFTSIPAIPQLGLNDWQYITFNAMKEDIELLIGARGEKDGISRAITKAMVTVNPAPTQTMTRVTAQGYSFTISNVNVPSLDDYVKLVVNVQQVANDVASLRNTLNTLINQLKG